jgi:hypothetical protein
MHYFAADSTAWMMRAAAPGSRRRTGASSVSRSRDFSSLGTSPVHRTVNVTRHLPVGVSTPRPAARRRRQPLLASRPPWRVAQQGLQAWPHRLQDRRRPCDRPALRLGPLDVAAHRVARDPQLSGDLSRRPPLDQHLVANDVDLIHPEHPPAEVPAAPTGKLPSDIGGSVSERRLDQFHGGGTTGEARRALGKLNAIWKNLAVKPPLAGSDSQRSFDEQVAQVKHALDVGNFTALHEAAVGALEGVHSLEKLYDGSAK